MRGIGTSLPEFREMSREAFLRNKLHTAGSSFGGGLGGFFGSLFGLLTNRMLPHATTNLSQEQVNERIRGMSPEEYERFSVYR